jgi:hypothetical protein
MWIFLHHAYIKEDGLLHRKRNRRWTVYIVECSDQTWSQDKEAQENRKPSRQQAPKLKTGNRVNKAKAQPSTRQQNRQSTRQRTAFTRQQNRQWQPTEHFHRQQNRQSTRDQNNRKAHRLQDQKSKWQERQKPNQECLEDDRQGPNLNDTN